MRKDLLFTAAAGLLLALLALLAYLMVASPVSTVPAGSPQAGNWTLSGMTGDPGMLEYYNVFFGDDGTIYTIDGKNVHAIGPDGRVRWSLAIPDPASDPRVKTWYSSDAATDNNTMYVTVRSSNTGSNELSELLAISPEGKLLWGTDDPPIWVIAKNDRLYAWKNNITVYKNDGTVAWTAGDAFDPPLIDDTGYMYFIKGMDENTLCVYGPNGRLKTTYNLTDYGLGPLADIFRVCPQIYYNNHTVYVPLEHGLIALGDGGAFKWKVALSDSNARLSFWNEMFDKNGNVYLENNSRIYYVTPAGDEHLLTDKYDQYWHGLSGSGLVSVEDDLYYTIRTISAVDGSYTSGYEASYDQIGWHSVGPGYRSPGRLDTCRVTAYDLKTGEPRWNMTLPMDVRMVNATAGGSTLVQSYSTASGMLSNGTLYVRFWSNNTEVPWEAGGPAKYTNAGGIYAINKDGSLAWYNPTGSRVLGMEAWNSRIIYYTADGVISALELPALPP